MGSLEIDFASPYNQLIGCLTCTVTYYFLWKLMFDIFSFIVVYSATFQMLNRNKNLPSCTIIFVHIVYTEQLAAFQSRDLWRQNNRAHAPSAQWISHQLHQKLVQTLENVPSDSNKLLDKAMTVDFFSSAGEHLVCSEINYVCCYSVDMLWSTWYRVQFSLFC